MPYLDAERVRRICDVERGIGADGVLEVVADRRVDRRVVIWNPDGSTAEMSGNGTRIAARWLAARDGATDVVVRVGSREVRARMIDGSRSRRTSGRSTSGGRDDRRPREAVEVTPVVGRATRMRSYSARSPRAKVLLRLGPLIETHARFPGSTNVQLAHPEGTHDVRALVWERGAGETSASGSSAIAVAAAAVAGGWCESPVTVHMPGGDLVVEHRRCEREAGRPGRAGL